MPDDITELKFRNAIKDSLDEIKATISNIQDGATNTNESILASYKNVHDDVNKKDKKASDERNEALEESASKASETMKSAGEIVKEKILSSITAGLTSIGNQFGSLLKQYTDEQQKLTFGLIGSGVTYNDVKLALSQVGTNAFVKQNELYKNLTNLVSSGITMNAAQRAFLQTTSAQVGLSFNALDGSLNRLIQLQQADLSEARVAQMAGLKEFLEQNYQNSQYIQQGFQTVSDALVEMQSLMTAQMAMSTEKAVQTYLGSFQSSGGANATAIAQALGQIGSGDFSGLSEGMRNLFVMAASKAGLSYADLLTGGLDQQSTEKLMAALFNYVAGMSDTAGGSNIAVSAIAKIFGVNVSDIKAAQNMNVGTGLNTGWNSDIANFFAKYEGSTPSSVRTDILWNNLISNEALTTEMTLTSWNLINDLSKTVGGILRAVGGAMPVGGVGLSLLGSALPAVPGLGVLGSMMINGGANPLNLLNGLGTLKDIATNGIGSFADTLIARLFPSIGYSGEVLDDYNLLGTNWADGSTSYSSTGTFSSRARGNAKSGKITNQTSKGFTEVSIETGEEPEAKTLDDLYSLLADEYPNTTFNTASMISKAYGGNEVLIGNAQNTQYISDMLTITAVSTENILMLLENVFAGGSRSLIDTSAIRLENQWGDLFGSASR